MIISDKFVFLHLQKCAGNAVNRFILGSIPGARQYGWGHNTIRDIPAEHKGKPIVATIRSPLEWYVSIYSHYTQRIPGAPPRNSSASHKKWRQKLDYYYRTVPGMEFKEFLRAVMLEIDGVDTIHEQFDAVRQLGVGIYTYRFMRSFASRMEIEELEKVRDGKVVPVFFIDIGNLDVGFNDFFSGIGCPVDVSIAKFNASDHKCCRDYYDDESIEWVREKDSMFSKRFGYEM